MSKGHVFVAQQSDVDYIRQAYALALSIKLHNKEHNQTCLVTNDEVPEEYKHAFDHIVSIPWTDLADRSVWKVENRWKVVHATPFEENLVYDVDMLLLNSNDHWWQYFEKHDVLLTSTVTTYRNDIVTSDFYRKAFTANNLPNVYVGVFYFKKVTFTFEFFKWIEVITANWKDFYKTHLSNHTQNFVSMDVNAALATKIMDCENLVLVKNTQMPSFVHMKPAIQGWKTPPAKWTHVVSSYFDEDCGLKVGNFRQQGVFHYTEPEFLEDHMIEKLRRKL
jgi:hypothetical protein